MQLFKCDSYEEMRKIAGNDKELIDIVNEIEKLNKDKFFGALYNIEEEKKKWIRTKEAELKEAKEEGERSKEIEIAKNMLEKGMSIEDISEITGLSKEEIEKLEV